ncbi:hypothetical protein EHZ50_19335, partial [Aeromonas caviae]
MSGGNGLHARHQYQGGGMKDDKDDAQLSGQWHRVCELAALPEQGGRSAASSHTRCHCPESCASS